jgi:hypothetical protein
MLEGDVPVDERIPTCRNALNCGLQLQTIACTHTHTNGAGIVEAAPVFFATFRASKSIVV